MANEKSKTTEPAPTIERLDPTTDGASTNILEENVERAHRDGG